MRSHIVTTMVRIFSVVTFGIQNEIAELYSLEKMVVGNIIIIMRLRIGVVI